MGCAYVGKYFEEKSLELIARKAEAYNGDLRMAMNVCSKALEICKNNVTREVSEVENAFKGNEEESVQKRMEIVKKYEYVPTGLVLEACNSAYNRGGNKETKSVISSLTEDQLLLLYIITWVIQQNAPTEKVHIKDIQSVYTRAKSCISMTSSNTGNGDIKMILHVLKDYALIDLPYNFGSGSNYSSNTTNNRDYITGRVKLVDVEKAIGSKELDQLKSMVQNRKAF